MADENNGKPTESGDQQLIMNQAPSNMNNNSSGIELAAAAARISNGPGVVSAEDKGITCAERASSEARSSHALNKVIMIE